MYTVCKYLDIYIFLMNVMEHIYVLIYFSIPRVTNVVVDVLCIIDISGHIYSLWFLIGYIIMLKLCLDLQKNSNDMAY